jgi:integrase
MATIEKRKTKDGKVTRYRVKWRTGGTGTWDGVTFDAHADAKQWRALVEAFGNQRPPEDQIIAHGFGYLLGRDRVVVVDPTSALKQADGRTPDQVTFEQYAREYVEGLVRPGRETKRKYLERLHLHVFPVIGQRPIGEITRREMRLWQAGLVDRGLSGKTIANIRGESLSPIFDAACLPGENDEPPLRSYNPLRGLDLPGHVKPERDIVENEDEARIFVEAAYAVDPEAADLVVTLLATGVRWGEGAGLPVRAVHGQAGTISIEQVVKQECRTWIVVRKPKTKKGFRQIPVPEQVMEMLLRRCEGRRRDDFVFTNPDGGFWRYGQFYEPRWVKIRKLAERNGLSKHLTPHGLRHSLLTLLASEGIDLDALRQIAGHKQISTTFDLYVHATRKHHRAVRAVVRPFLGAGGLPTAS